jgi:hypothetical protein
MLSSTSSCALLLMAGSVQDGVKLSPAQSLLCCQSMSVAAFSPNCARSVGCIHLIHLLNCNIDIGQDFDKTHKDIG